MFHLFVKLFLFETFATKNPRSATPPTIYREAVFASNLTKDALIVQKTAMLESDLDSQTTVSVTESKLNARTVPDAKKLMLQNLQKVQKVWYAFVKFVKSQVTVNGRLLDTSIFGLFYKDNANSGNVVFMPSMEYLEAGKFKLSRTSPNNETVAATSMAEYSAKYAEKIRSTSKGELCVLSYSSIAMVTDT